MKASICIVTVTLLTAACSKPPAVQAQPPIKETPTLSPKTHIEGQVFMISENGQGVPMAGVEVFAIKKDLVFKSMDPAIARHRDYIDSYAAQEAAAIEAFKRTGRSSTALTTFNEQMKAVKISRDSATEVVMLEASTTFGSDALDQSETGVDGKFALDLNSDPWTFFIFAELDRTVRGSDETYYWLVPAVAARPLFLTKKNVFRPDAWIAEDKAGILK
jgi:hypothetical protein